MQSRYLDKFAVALSGLCLIHCAAVPILALSAPLLAGSLLTSEAFHGLLLAVILPTSTLALWLGFRSHGRLTLLMTGVGAMVVLTTAAILFHEGLVPRSAEIGLTALGGLLLAAVHVGNYRQLALEKLP